MKPNEYQERARLTATWGEDTDYAQRYIAVSLIGEVGEIVNVLKKEMRAHEDRTRELVDEIGDVFWYICAYLDLEGMSLQTLIDTAAAQPTNPISVLDLAIGMAYDTVDIAIDIKEALKDQALRHLRGLMGYLLLLAKQRGISLDEIYRSNLAKIEHRHATGTVKKHD